MTVYKSGDQVTYGIHGVCNIIAVEKQRVGKKLVEYYVLEPVHCAGSRFYVPTKNEIAVSKLNPVLDASQVQQLLASDAVRQDVWIEDEGQRRLRYKELIASGDRAALVSMVHCLYRHREEQTAAGRKFHLSDENFLNDAQKLLGSEFSIALQIPEDEVEEFVRSAFG